MPDRPDRVVRHRHRITAVIATGRPSHPALHEVLAVGLGLQPRDLSLPRNADPIRTRRQSRLRWSTGTWAAAWSPVVLVAGAAGLVRGDLSALVGWFCFGAITTGLLARSREDRRRAAHAPRHQHHRWSPRDPSTVVSAPTLGACGGLVALSMHVGHVLVGTPTYAIAIVAAATSPRALLAVSAGGGRRLRGVARASAGPTDSDLHQRWRETSEELASARDAEHAVALARTRGLLLDEIEKRHPALVRRWITFGIPPWETRADPAPPITPPNDAGTGNY